jgi:hypothetical protein
LVSEITTAIAHEGAVARFVTARAECAGADEGEVEGAARLAYAALGIVGQLAGDEAVPSQRDFRAQAPEAVGGDVREVVRRGLELGLGRAHGAPHPIHTIHGGDRTPRP